MNANQILNMIVRMVTRRLISRGLNAGLKKVAGPDQGHGKQARRARQTLRTARRIGRL